MKAKFALAGFLGAASLVAAARPAIADTEYPASSLLDALRTLPCEAFQKDIDGAWLLIGRIRIGERVVYGEIWKDNRESKILDARCAPK